MVVDSTAHTLTTSTTTAGTTNAKTQVSVAGLVTSATGFNGLTEQVGYDSLWRANQRTDTRGNTTTTHFISGTLLPSYIQDATSTTIASYTYDTAARIIARTNAVGNTTRYAYDTHDHVLNVWGDAAYPVAYGYDEFGARTTMTTYRGGSGWNSSTWPTSPGTGDLTTWNYDPGSGLLASKVDSASATTSYKYLPDGRTHQRTDARGIATTYGYDPNTGDLTTVSYSDGTPGITYQYTRSGLLKTVTDASSTSSTDNTRFTYNPNQPLQLQSEQLSSFYSNRVMTPQYNTDGLRPGRPSGFQLGTAASPAADASQTYAYDNTMRLHQISASTSGKTATPFTYTYYNQSDFIGQMAATGSNATFEINYGYEAKRNLVDQVQSEWGGSTPMALTQFDYTNDAEGRRQYVQLSGAAFEDYYEGASTTPVYWLHTYDAQGQIQTSVMYRGTPPASGEPSSADELPARRFEYRYDGFGNRTLSGAADPGGSDAAQNDVYADANYGKLNQYDTKENNTVRIVGDAAMGATVTIPGASVTQLDRNYGTFILPSNQSGPVQGSFSVTADLTQNGTEYTDTQSRNYLVPAASQAFHYDANGNLTSDGMWSYTYDAENRLTEMDSLLPQGFTRLKLVFKYDYLNRRIEKQVYNMDVNPGVPTLDHRYIYDGWNLVAETDASSNLLRTYTWGLDVAGSLKAAGGVGALLQLTNVSGGSTTSYFVADDASGNVAALVNSVGSATSPYLAAVYEYGPFGEPLRAEVMDSTVQDNPFRFSSKYTDAETGLVYYGNRYYSPRLGRFISRDPVGESGGLNLYGFVGNDPVNAWDVLGNSPDNVDMMAPVIVSATRPSSTTVADDPVEDYVSGMIETDLVRDVTQYEYLADDGSNPFFMNSTPQLAAAVAMQVAIQAAQQAQNQRLKAHVWLELAKKLGLSPAFYGIDPTTGRLVVGGSPIRMAAFEVNGGKAPNSGVAPNGNDTLLGKVNMLIATAGGQTATNIINGAGDAASAAQVGVAGFTNTLTFGATGTGGANPNDPAFKTGQAIGTPTRVVETTLAGAQAFSVAGSGMPYFFSGAGAGARAAAAGYVVTDTAGGMVANGAQQVLNTVLGARVGGTVGYYAIWYPTSAVYATTAGLLNGVVGYTGNGTGQIYTQVELPVLTLLGTTVRKGP